MEDDLVGGHVPRDIESMTGLESIGLFEAESPEDNHQMIVRNRTSIFSQHLQYICDLIQLSQLPTQFSR